MAEPEDDYQARILKAVMYAIMRNSAVPLGNGRQGCEIREFEVCVVLTNIVAEFMASRAVDAGETSKKAIREMSEAVGKAVRVRMQAVIDGGQTIPSFMEIDPDPKDPSLN